MKTNMQTPDFWYAPPGVRSRLLAPLGYLYGKATQHRLARAKPEQSDPPVICIGNLTAGGGGKTPSAIALHRLLGRPDTHFLSRGHGGRTAGPVMVNPRQHQARDVGDEPLLLARHAPCWVARDRAAGHNAAASSGARLIIMDDGLQNPSLTPSLRLLAVKGPLGFGNGQLIPAGPLREPLTSGLARVDAVFSIGAPEHPSLTKTIGDKPMFIGHYVPDATTIASLQNQPCIAFAGIARPDGFFGMLKEHGITLANELGFADHETLSDGAWQQLIHLAKSYDAQLVTTEKDWVRLKPEQREQVTTVPITLSWENPSALAGFVMERLKAQTDEAADVS